MNMIRLFTFKTIRTRCVEGFEILRWCGGIIKSTIMWIIGDDMEEI